MLLFVLRFERDVAARRSNPIKKERAVHPGRIGISDQGACCHHEQSCKPPRGKDVQMCDPGKLTASNSQCSFRSTDEHGV